MTDAEEKEIINALESGAIQLEKPSRKLLSDLKTAFENTLKNDLQINTSANGTPASSPIIPS
jgi:hypothetical protein